MVLLMKRVGYCYKECGETRMLVLDAWSITGEQWCFCVTCGDVDIRLELVSTDGQIEFKHG